ncbi:unnamed protein product, partial [Mesorhabditis belari]|uniref:Uncharacterized protein n=1 Tax=Mesorhabditis belari TaxID=2138241 RepID=A0AAF3F4V8_9BILA
MPNFSINTSNSYSFLEEIAEDSINIDQQIKNRINGSLDENVNKKENKKENKNEKKSKNEKKKASGIVNGLFKNLPHPFDFSKFFNAELLTVEWPEVSNNCLSLHLTPNRSDLELTIDKWELPGVIFRVEQQMNEEQKGALLEIDYSSEESRKNLRKVQRIPINSLHYACIRFDWNDEKNECIPSFFFHRLLQGRDQLNERMQEPIETNGTLDFVQGVPLFDQELADIRFFNDSSTILDFSIPWCDPINKGIHYIYPGWKESRSSPSKYAFSIAPKQWARLKITFQLPRTKECLREMAENNEYVWIVIYLKGEGYYKKIERRFNFTLHWNAEN